MHLSYAEQSGSPKQPAHEVQQLAAVHWSQESSPLTVSVPHSMPASTAASAPAS